MRARQLPGAKMCFELDVEISAFLVGIVGQVGQRRRLIAAAGKRRAAERLERLHGHDPGRYRGSETLAEERPERLVLPGLDVARRPVVEQHHAEDLLRRLRNRHRLSQRIARPDDEAQLEFEIQPLAGTEHRRRCVRRVGLSTGLPTWTYHRRAAHHDRRGTPVVADRHPVVIRQQRVVRPEHPARVLRVVDAGVEVAVVADRDRQEQFRLFHRHQVLREFLPVLRIRQHIREEFPDRFPGGAPGCGKNVERRPGIQPHRGEVENLVTDRHAAARAFLGSFPPENSERKVLDRKIAGRVVGALDPALQLWIVSLVHLNFFLNPSQTVS